MSGSEQGKDTQLTNYGKMAILGKKLFLKYDQQKMIDRFGLAADEQYIYVDYIDEKCRIDRQTSIVEHIYETDDWTPATNPQSVLTVYDMLCHFQDTGSAFLSGDYCSVTGLTVARADPFPEYTQNFANAFIGRTDDLAAACERIGGRVQPRKARADITYYIPIFEWFGTFFQFWDGDDEFPPKVMFLWDHNSPGFMHIETLYYVMGDIMTKLVGGADAKLAAVIYDRECLDGRIAASLSDDDLENFS